MGGTVRRDALLERVDLGDVDVLARSPAVDAVRRALDAVVRETRRLLADDPAAVEELGGDAWLDRRERALRDWLEALLLSPPDAAWVTGLERRHGALSLPQRYVLLVMSRVRAGLHRALDEVGDRRAHAAVDARCDLGLAILVDASRARDVSRERLAALGQLAASIGHELRTPLATIRSSAFLAREDGVLEPHLDKIERQAILAEKIITDILEMVRDAPPARARFDLVALLHEACEAANDGGCTKLVVEAGAHTVHADRVAIRQLLINLIDNALRSARGHHPEAGVEVTARPEGGDLVVQVRDGGSGFPRQILERRFAPLSSSRPDGLGLGLALCARIAERHGGSLHAENPPEGGALVVARIADAIAEPPG